MKIYSYVDTTRANADGSYPVYIIVSNGFGRFFMNTGMTSCRKLDGMTFPKEDKNWRQKTTLLSNLISKVEEVCLRMASRECTNKELKKVLMQEVFGMEPREKSLNLSGYVSAFAATKRKSTAVLYGITARKVEAYDSKATFKSVDAAWLESFRTWCIDSGMSINGAAKELRNIRAVFNWARDMELTTCYPFSRYSITEEETIPNNISVEQLRKLRDYPCEEWQEKYRDFFMLSFYLAGINPVDLLNCKSDAVKNGHISFVRQKTNKQGIRKIRQIIIPVVEEAQRIIDRYKSRDGWLLSFMDERTDYHSFVKKANEALKKIGTSEKVEDKLGKMRKVKYHPLFPDITLYTARYTFGSIAANELDISERTIGMCLGHSWSKNVTSRYMAYDQAKIDKAVRSVVDYVNNG